MSGNTLDLKDVTFESISSVAEPLIDIISCSSFMLKGKNEFKQTTNILDTGLIELKQDLYKKISLESTSSITYSGTGCVFYCVSSTLDELQQSLEGGGVLSNLNLPKETSDEIEYN